MEDYPEPKAFGFSLRVGHTQFAILKKEINLWPFRNKLGSVGTTCLMLNPGAL